MNVTNWSLRWGLSEQSFHPQGHRKCGKSDKGSYTSCVPQTSIRGSGSWLVNHCFITPSSQQHAQTRVRENKYKEDSPGPGEANNVSPTAESCTHQCACSQALPGLGNDSDLIRESFLLLKGIKLGSQHRILAPFSSYWPSLSTLKFLSKDLPCILGLSLHTYTLRQQ